MDGGLMFGVGVVVLTYFIGSIPFGFIVCRFGYDIDIRAHGSKNIGFTNVLRTVGKWPAAITLVGDISKGALAIVIARLFGLSDYFVILCGLAVIAGHNWSIFLKFRAGRGVATGFGVALALTWQPTLILIILWVIILAVTRYISLASVISVGLYPFAIYLLKLPTPYVIMGVVGAMAIIWQHRRNIKRLLKGEEPRVGKRLKTERAEVSKEEKK